MIDGADVLLDAAARIPLLTPDEEIHLGRMVQAMQALLERNADGPYTKAEKLVIRRGTRARDRMVAANIRLVGSIVRRYQWLLRNTFSLEVEDLMQHGCMGLVRAVEKFDPERGYKFGTYAYWWIRQGVGRALSHEGRTIRLPIHIVESLGTLHRRVKQLRDELGRAPTNDEIAAAMGWQREYMEHVMMMSSQTLSLNQSLNNADSVDLEDAALTDGGTADAHLEEVQESLNRDAVQVALSVLNPREQLVIRGRFGMDGDPLTLTAIGKRLGVTRQRVQLIEQSAMRKLRLKLSSRFEVPGLNVA